MDELNSIKGQIRDFRKYGEINPFDFHDIPHDNDIDLDKFVNIAENNVVVYKNDQLFNVIFDASRDK